ncbi:hypothetical protein AWB67_05748 [Caballeronia terrestris]|jgi:hypothetical protein|uniref:Uncharacterized protein n=1 Tax=Caballeronia terrestris TaxID=1226301 RepID=A0A158KIX1_9BURK|nr:hypothetical protein [Caballeronia terrestris]SAL81047.1 hypothetical protein AWB67_05748 [Caballeronia terrestris]
MDLRDIQRLHAQFAPDSMTIDLPRQIAALPAPAGVTAEAKAPAIKLRLPKGALVVRRSVIAVAIATVVAMAGMGAASLYKSFHATSARSANGQPAHEAKPDAARSEKKESRASDAALRPIDAEPPQPVAMSPKLTAKDFGPTAPIGLTADQFKSSLDKTSGQAVSAVAPAAKPAAPLSNDEQRAAASPIRQLRRENEAPAQAPIKPTTTAVSTVPAPTVSVVPAQSVAQATAQDRASPTNAAEPIRSHRHRQSSRSREEQVSDGDAASAASKKPASASRAGANEVQMF